MHKISMRRIYLKKRINLKTSYLFIIVIVAILILAVFQYSYYIKNINSKLFYIVQVQLSTINSTIVNQSINNQKTNKYNFDDIIIVNKNSENDISVIDYDLEKIYSILKEVNLKIQDQLWKIRKGDTTDLKYMDRKIIGNGNGFYLNIPFGVIFNNPYLASLGPKIPVKIAISGNLYSNIKTKVTNYGINNALLQVYIELDLYEQVYIPAAQKKVNYKYDVLIASKIIQGKIPEYFGGAITGESSIFTFPIN